jgi:integrase
MTATTRINTLTLKAALKKKGRHRIEKGLALKVIDHERAYFIARYRFGGKERETSLGSAYDITLADAKAKHLAIKNMLTNEKRDPLAGRGKAASGLPAISGMPTFGQCADHYIATHETSWANAKHHAQYVMTLTKYCAPIRDLPVDQVATADVLKILQPLWSRVPETASRLRARIEMVLDAARVQGHIADDRPNPARWRGHLKLLLPDGKKLKPVTHHRAMPYREIPAFAERLRSLATVSARALEFLILTASRTGEITGMVWSEVDLDAATWTIPAARMKMKRDHVVPLSDRAVEILRDQLAKRSSSSFGDHPFVFEGARSRCGLSNMALLELLRAMKVPVTSHGFRASFRSWCADRAVAFEVAEACLAHSSSSIVEAYQRSAMLERRRPVMQMWTDYLDGVEADNVVELRRAAE